MIKLVVEIIFNLGVDIILVLTYRIVLNLFSNKNNF